MNSFPSAFFVTGTDTMIGKTFVSAMLCKGLNAGYWKPIQSGITEGTDTQWVRDTTGLSSDHFYPETYCLTEPLSPHASAAIDGVRIDLDQFKLPAFKQKHLIVEGAGGLLVPLNEDELIIDLIARLDLPVLLVARSQLGTINHTLLSIKTLRDHGLQLLGVVMNGPRNNGNLAAIEHYGQTQVIAHVEPIEEVTPLTIDAAFHRFFGSSYADSNRGLSDLASVHANENSRSAASR